MAKITYSHTQKGSFVLWGAVELLILIIIILNLFLTSFYHMDSRAIIGTIIPAFFVLILVFLFGDLHVEVDETWLYFWFGPGLFRKKIQLSKIEKSESIIYPWWYGYGIRFTPQGVLYNVAGNKAIKLTFQNGKTSLIGTDDPEGLLAALQKPNF